MSEFNTREPGLDVLHHVGENVYTCVTGFLFDGKFPMQNRSVIVHVPARSAGERGALVIINPVELSPAMEQGIRRLEEQTNATVKYLISPGDWHYLFIGQHVKAFPEARAHVPPGRIPGKNPDFPYTLIDVEADNPFPELAPHVVVQSCKGLLDFTDPEGKLPRYELVFYLPALRAITSGDVFFYVGADELSPMQKTFGMQLHVLDLHFMKWRMVKDPEALRASLARILEWDFDRYIAIHGDPGNMQAQGSKADVEKILAWARTPPESTSA
jgi:hypothetical protein